MFRLGRFVAEARAGLLEVAAWEEAQGRAAGATGWLVKPFDPQKLIEVVRKVIG